jgi:hypothetical protein
LSIRVPKKFLKKRNFSLIDVKTWKRKCLKRKLSELKSRSKLSNEKRWLTGSGQQLTASSEKEINRKTITTNTTKNKKIINELTSPKPPMTSATTRISSPTSTSPIATVSSPKS